MKLFSILFLNTVLTLGLTQPLVDIGDETSNDIPPLSERNNRNCAFAWRTNSKNSKLPHRRSFPDSYTEQRTGTQTHPDFNEDPSPAAPLAPRFTFDIGSASVRLWDPSNKEIGYNNALMLGPVTMNIPMGTVKFDKLWADKSVAGKPLGFFIPLVHVNGIYAGYCDNCNTVEGLDECKCVFTCAA